MRILVTRPRPDAERFGEVLESLGHQVEIEPVFEVAARDDATIDLDGIQAILFTSANGVRAFCSALKGCCPSDLKPHVFAVGDASARMAAEYGFTQIESAGGDVTDLIKLVADRLDPAAGGLFHAAGSKLAGDLKGGVEAAGFAFRRAVLYETREISDLSPKVATLLSDGQIDAVTFFSPRTASSFVRLACAAGLEERLEASLAVCLSRAVRDKLKPLRWKSVLVADRPTQAALLALLDE